MKEKRGQRMWKVTVPVIAAVSGVGEHQVRYARKIGEIKLDGPIEEVFESMVRYTAGFLLKEGK